MWFSLFLYSILNNELEEVQKALNDLTVLFVQVTSKHQCLAAHYTVCCFQTITDISGFSHYTVSQVCTHREQHQNRKWFLSFLQLWQETGVNSQQPVHSQVAASTDISLTISLTQIDSAAFHRILSILIWIHRCCSCCLSCYQATLLLPY